MSGDDQALSVAEWRAKNISWCFVCKQETLPLPDNICGWCDMPIGKKRRVLPRTHCYRGHELTEANTRTSRSGNRECRTCMNKRRRVNRAA